MASFVESTIDPWVQWLTLFRGLLAGPSAMGDRGERPVSHTDQWLSLLLEGQTKRGPWLW